SPPVESRPLSRRIQPWRRDAPPRRPPKVGGQAAARAPTRALLRPPLTHNDITGYNEHGACLLFEFDLEEEATEASSERSAPVEGGADWLGRTAEVANKVLHVAQVGRLERGGTRMGEWRRGDFRRGLWVTLTGLPSITLVGRRSRGKDAATRPSVLDVGRGWWELCRGRVGRRRPHMGAHRVDSGDGDRTPPGCREAGLEGLGRMVIPISDLSIPEVLHAGGTVYYRIRVCGSDDLDLESRGIHDAWSVRRSYADFLGLANRLGRQSREWRDAPFPGKFSARKPISQQREARRKKLEAPEEEEPRSLAI
ncbi:unnamed protein product, partial [Prorocentrum cordatum]